MTLFITPQLLDVLRQHPFMTREHYERVILKRPDAPCPCLICRDNGPLPEWESQISVCHCTQCDATLLYASRWIFPAPHWDVFIMSVCSRTRAASTHPPTYTFCAQCNQHALLRCHQCESPATDDTVICPKCQQSGELQAE